ncbi:response regulator [Pseudidiomarina salinarum]|nr:response regulator transcription factor [Pseudidiomarina salinarum]
MIRLILADDHTLVRNAIAQALEATGQFRVVCQCADGTELYQAALNVAADVILMDISMPKMNGFVALDKILQQRPDSKIIALSMHNEMEYIDAIRRGGARGYVFKDATTEQLTQVILRVIGGKTWFPQTANGSDATNPAAGETAGPSLDVLTRREREVFFLVVAGRSTREIANLLAMSPKTAENHRGKVLRKLSASNTVELIHFAAKRGLLEP